MRFLSAALTLLAPLSLYASTGFHVGDGSYAISTGWYYAVDAAAMVNGRGTERTVELFGAAGTPAHWVSRYGSLSISMRGPGFAMSGMNEKGLMIQATILKGKEQVHPPEGMSGAPHAHDG
jgi:penicillin V acylase-like amidase (Ntn superfamily)